MVETPGFERDLLERFYRLVLQPSVPADELMTLEEVCDAYLGDDPCPGALLVEDGNPVAGILAEPYDKSDVLLISYFAVLRGHRGRGKGTALAAQTIPRWLSSLRPALVVAEVDDPRFHDGDDDTGDPVARLRFYDRIGARLLAMPYFQPSLRPDCPRVHGMLLIAFGIDGDFVEGHVVAKWLEEYFVACEGEAVLPDSEFVALLDCTGGESGRLPIWPLSRFADVPPLSAPKVGQ